MNSELRRPAVNSVKRGNIFVIRTLGKVDSAERVTLLSGTAFVHINRAMTCINVSIFFLKSLPFNKNTSSRFGRLIPHFGRTLIARIGRYFELCNVMMW